MGWLSQDGNPVSLEPQWTNYQGPNRNAHGGFIAGIARHPIGEFVCRIVYVPWHAIFPPGLEYGFYIEMGGYELVPASPESDFNGTVTPRGAIELARAHILPEVPLALIKDQSKFDIVAKLLVCIQAVWMIIQCSARVTQSLPLALLEAHTVIQTICAISMYFLWFKKPHDVKVPTKVRVDDAMLEKLNGIVNAKPPGYKLTDPKNWEQWVPLNVVAPSSYGLLLGSKQSQITKDVLACLMGPIYGGVHLAAWNGHFPSNLERILWIASSLSIMVWPPFCILTILLNKFLLRLETDHGMEESNENLQSEAPGMGFTAQQTILVSLGRRKKWGWFVLYLLLSTLWVILGISYALARYYLVWESFASLRNLPLGIYDAVSWVSLIPHV